MPNLVGVDVNNPEISKATWTWVLPFWLPGGPRPLLLDERRNVLADMRDRLNAAPNPTGARNWRLDRKYYANLEPYGPVTHNRSRLIADIDPPPEIADSFTRYIAGRSLQGRLAVKIESSLLRMEDFGLGTLEFDYTIAGQNGISDSCTKEIVDLLTDGPFWQDLDEMGNQLVEEGGLPIQKDWQTLSRTLGDVFAKLKIQFPDTMNFLVPSGRNDDICNVRGANIVIFRRGPLNDQVGSDTRKYDMELVRRVASTCNAGAPVEVAGYYHDVGPGSLDVLATGFGIVALVSEDENPICPEDDGIKVGTLLVGPSGRLKAIWRYVHLNYAALTASADGLLFSLRRALLEAGRQSPELSSAHERLTHLVTLLSLVRYSTVPGNFEADDFETLTYRDAYKVWGIGEAESVLRDVISDADRITSRLSELAVQAEQRTLNRFAGILALLGAAGAIFSGLQLLGLTVSQHPWDEFSLRITMFTGYIVFVIAVAMKSGWARSFKIWIRSFLRR